MGNGLTRRGFLKIGGISLSALAFHPSELMPIPWSPNNSSLQEMVGRVTRKTIQVYEKPDLSSTSIREIPRDSILPLMEEVNATDGPRENPRWYRLGRGYVHSAYIQRVENIHLNPPLSSVPESGQLGEITVPYSQTQYKTRKGQWMQLYRLYYQTIHWIIEIVESPTGQPWYCILDERLRIRYYVPAAHVRPIPPEELAPISPHIPADKKRIEVSIAEQRLSAYEGERLVYQARVSTGRRYMETPTGRFNVDRKHPSKHMGDGGITREINAYELVGVPWASFFQTAGIAFHGTFWHDNFGVPMSQGCVNLRNHDAKWLFRWCAPVFSPVVSDRSRWKVTGAGTQVIVY